MNNSNVVSTDLLIIEPVRQDSQQLFMRQIHSKRMAIVKKLFSLKKAKRSERIFFRVRLLRRRPLKSS